MSLIVSGIFFAIFAANVVIGSASGAPFLSDIAEMLMLFVSSLAFVAAILEREAVAKRERSK